jgi:hypothetical protein
MTAASTKVGSNKNVPSPKQLSKAAAHTGAVTPDSASDRATRRRI